MSSVHQLPRKKFLENLRGHVHQEDRVVTLVVGEVRRWASEGREIPYVDDLTFVDFEHLNQTTIAKVRPDVVLSPLLSDAFDAYQIVRFLASFGYVGRYRALAQYLPDMAMIRSEIRKAAPNIDFEIVMMPTPLRLVG